MTTTADAGATSLPPPAPATNPRATSTPSRRHVVGPRRRAVALGLLVSAQFVVMLDTSIVNVALPSIQRDLGLSPTGLTWVVSAYVLAFGGLLLLSGRVADLFGRRRTFVAGSVVFTVGTVVAATAGGLGVLVGGRLLQGVGAAALSPAAMSLLLLTFPGKARAKAMSAWGAASAVGGATGVLVGGILAGSFGWASVFLVTAPFSIASVVLARMVLEDGAAGGGHRFDWAGAVAVTGAVVALVHAALSAADGDVTSPDTLASLVAFIVLVTALLHIERRAAEPLVPLGLFRSRGLSAGVGLALLGGAARASTFVLVALYLQQALLMAPRQAGLAMVPTSLTGFAVSLMLLRRVLHALGPQRTLVLGMVVLATGHLWLAYGSGGYLVAVLPGLVLVATGVALSFTPTTMVVASAMPEAHSGLASGLAGSATQVGAALGTAAFTAIAIAAGGSSDGLLASSGFTAAFASAAAVSLLTAALGFTAPRTRR